MMVKLDVYSGLLGNGKTTLIKQMLKTAYAGYRVAIIENEIGEINLDKEEFTENSVCVREVTAGCLCCTVKGNFQEAVRTIADQENPDYIVVEPTGTADIQGIIEACKHINTVKQNRCIMVVNARKIQILLKVAGEFFYDQIRTVRTVYLNFADQMERQQVEKIKTDLWNVNPRLKIVDVPMDKITRGVFGEQECLDGERQTKRKRNQIVVCSERENIKMLSGAKSVKKLFTWTVRFQETFSSEEIEYLLRLLKDEEHCRLWRAKGYLPMEDGSIRKLDVVYDEVFQEEREQIPKEKTGFLILIGTKLDIHWLQEEFRQSQTRD